MDLTVIISYYKAIDNLRLILKALDRQTFNNFEVIVSEDDNNKDTIDYILKNKDLFNFPITHLYQKKDNGFRKNKMLNRSIIESKTEKLIFIDGDCIPHRHFVKEYAKNIKENENYYYSGRAVFLNKNLSEKISTTQSLEMINQFLFLLTNSKKIKDGLYFPAFSLSHKARAIVGRNWGICKKLLLDINGFDEDYVFAAVGEDNDVEWRLAANGNKIKSMKNKAIVYHLYHPRTYSAENVKFNTKLMDKKQGENNIACLNGIKSIDKDQVQ